MDPRAVKVLREVLADGAPVRMRVTGQSMRPLLRSGDVVELRPLGGPVRVGDIVAVAWKSRIVLHRVVRVEEAAGRREIFLRGDGQSREHGPHEDADVVGRFGRVCREGRWMRAISWRLRDKASRAISMGRRAKAALGGRKGAT